MHVLAVIKIARLVLRSQQPYFLWYYEIDFRPFLSGQSGWEHRFRFSIFLFHISRAHFPFRKLPFFRFPLHKKMMIKCEFSERLAIKPYGFDHICVDEWRPIKIEMAWRALIYCDIDIFFLHKIESITYVKIDAAINNWLVAKSWRHIHALNIRSIARLSEPCHTRIQHTPAPASDVTHRIADLLRVVECILNRTARLLCHRIYT